MLLLCQNPYTSILYIFYVADVQIYQNKTGLEKLKFMYKFMYDEVQIFKL